ncbi:MAG: nucleoside triphosphate pyrophosphohydrolase [Oscillospiraceae bacterium]|nr:nucleoside triphosphate pyrophosphohydrolase [Oscillospiraceae bacterium]
MDKQYADKKYTVDDLIETVEILRGENGCPWDRVQTHESIKKSFIEEVYEAIDALDAGNDAMFANELGDVLMQIVFHSQLAKERGAFDFYTCVNEICTKLISRHSHVFGDDKAANAAESLGVWEKNKLKEKGLKSYTEALEDIPHSLPALMRAEKVQKKASDAGFDWTDIDGAERKLTEEISEFKEALAGNNKADAEEEFGDLLFAAVNVGRFAGINSELALYNAVNKFIKRFALVESEITASEKKMNETSLEEMDEIWNKIKKKP